MRHPPYAQWFACAVVGAAILLTSYNGSLSWLGLLGFLVVVFPRWRGKLYRLAEKFLAGRDAE